MYQSTTIIGNLGRDPEMKYLPDGTAITNVSVAVSDGYGDKKYTQWYRVSVFGKSAEACNQYLSKGKKCLVVGSLQADPQTGSPRVFSRKDGSSGAAFEIRAREVKFLSGRDEDGGNAPQAQPQTAQKAAPIEEDDIPF